ncbi:MAG: phosphoglycerate kinase [Elusimicrobiota bacterium]|jgi:3-phosphoglycerate kinase|nr:phosphoglycerate kinase [Elusimicrobiota bacterium]
MNKKSIKDFNSGLNNKKVIVRVDFNVPLDEKGEITNDKRIVAAVPTIQYLLDKNCAIILMSHLGRPKGQVVPSMSLAPVAIALKKIFKDNNVIMAKDCIGSDVEKQAKALKQQEILLLENLRFHKEEEANDDNFAKKLASLAEIFVQDAFGAVHRAHASTSGITKYLPSVAGLLVEKELEYLGNALNNPKRPFLAILGGAKVSDKISVIENLLNKVDALIIGGAMAYTFLKSQGIDIGASRVEEDKVELAKKLLEKAKSKGIKLLLPIDHVVAKEFDENAEAIITDGVNIPTGTMALDIGPKTIELYRNEILRAKTIVNNGPMGVFEFKKFSNGTIKIAESLAEATEKGAISVVGGGDSASAVKKAGVDKKISHVSTGGGASLEFLEGKELPGISSLLDK